MRAYGALRPATQSRQISQKCTDTIDPPAQQGIAFVYVARDTQPCLPSNEDSHDPTLKPENLS
jgi:hypothetical protein